MPPCDASAMAPPLLAAPAVPSSPPSSSSDSARPCSVEAAAALPPALPEAWLCRRSDLRRLAGEDCSWAAASSSALAAPAAAAGDGSSASSSAAALARRFMPTTSRSSQGGARQPGLRGAAPPFRAALRRAPEAGPCCWCLGAAMLKCVRETGVALHVRAGETRSIEWAVLALRPGLPSLIQQPLHICRITCSTLGLLIHTPASGTNRPWPDATAWPRC